jgi:hypothetical protein
MNPRMAVIMGVFQVLWAYFSGPLGLLRFIDSLATSGAMEHHRGVR